MQGKKYTGPRGDFAPEMRKEPWENVKRAPENSHRHNVNCSQIWPMCSKSSPRKFKINFFPGKMYGIQMI